jgi:hypothetical protein
MTRDEVAVRLDALGPERLYVLKLIAAALDGVTKTEAA